MKEERVLVSMVQYVLKKEIPETHEEGESEFILADNFYRHVPLYARLLSRNLCLGMFISCDEKGNVLYKPEKYSFFERGITNGETYDWVKKCQEFKEAEERVLFKGIQFFHHHTNEFNTSVSFKINGAIINLILDDKKIEDLVPLKPILTATAIKMIEG